MYQKRLLVHGLVLFTFLFSFTGQSFAQSHQPDPFHGRKLPVNVDKNDPRWVLMLPDTRRHQIPKQVLAKAVARFGRKACALRPSFLSRHNTNYSYIIPSRDNVPFDPADQKRSGSCWIFSTMRHLDSILNVKKVKAEPLSISWIKYHALRDQSRALLDRGIKADKKSMDQLQDLFADGKSWSYIMSEGGWHSWALQTIKRHGLVPESAMKTTADANNTGVLFTQARMLISQAYKKMDKVDSRKQRGKIKKEYLVKIDQLLKSSLGPLPRRIKIDEKGAQGQGISYSPKQYMTQHLKLTEADFDYVTLLHDPNLGRNPRNWYRKTTWKDGYAWPAVEMINVPMKVMQQATISTLRQGEAVWFAINGSLSSNPYAVDDGTAKIHKGKGQGVICEKAFDYGLFGPKVRLSKRDRRACHHLDENHAMAIIGYDMGKPRKSSDGKRHRRTEPLKWLVENSWGQAGDHGLLHLYRDAYKNEVINVVVPRSILPAYVLEKAASKPAIEINR